MEFDRITDGGRNSSLRCLTSLFHQSGPSYFLTCLQQGPDPSHWFWDLVIYHSKIWPKGERVFLKKKVVLPTSTFQHITGSLPVCEALVRQVICLYATDRANQIVSSRNQSRQVYHTPLSSWLRHSCPTRGNWGMSHVLSVCRRRREPRYPPSPQRTYRQSSDWLPCWPPLPYAYFP